MPAHHGTPEPLRESTLAVLARFGLTMDEERRRSYYAQGWWSGSTVISGVDRACRENPEKTAIVTYRSGVPDPNRLSYGDLSFAVRRTASALVHLGVESGDVVSVQLPNWWEFAVVALAVQRIGGVLNPIIPIHRCREVAFITGLLGSKVCIVPRVFRKFDHAQMLAEVANRVPSIAHRVIVGGEAGDGELSFEDDVLGKPWEQTYGADVDQREVDSDGLCDIQFTSGTTGEPKGVGHTHNTLNARIRALYQTLDLDPADSVFMPSTLAHSTGFVYGCMTPLAYGMTAVLQDVWDPVRGLDIINAERATWTFGSTAFIVDLVRAHRAHPTDMSSLRFFVSGGAPIPPRVVDDARDELGTRVIAVWGMTENGAVTFTQLAEPVRAAAESDGIPCPWMELRIVDPASNATLPCGVEGMLEVRGASQMLGYVSRPTLTAESVDGQGWFDTGDLALIDADGHLRITGRSKDIIIRGGENVPVAEIEKMLYEHPAVQDVVVVSYPDDRLGERACAVVVPADDTHVTLDMLTRYLADAGMSRTYWPEMLVIRDELPRTLTGKVQKFRLREEIAAGDATTS